MPPAVYGDDERERERENLLMFSLITTRHDKGFPGAVL
jgi:hypothetical protein